MIDHRTKSLSIELLDLLVDHLAEPELSYDGEPAPLTGGFWAELIAFRLRGAPEGWRQPLVARVMPDAAIAAKEVAFQGSVASQGYPTPIVRLHRDASTGIDGRALMVMDMAKGASLLGGLDGIAAIIKLPSLARRLPVVLAEALAHLHGLDSALVGALLPVDAPRPDIDTMLGHLRASAARVERPSLAACVSWLSDHRPPNQPDVICHGDMHPFNVLVDQTDNITVLDWSAALIAPGAYDLGFTSLMLAEPPLVVAGWLRPVVRRAGSWLSRRFLRAYEAQAGVRVDPEALAWFQGLICVRALSEVANWTVAGDLANKTGHPWVINQAALGQRLLKITGIAVPVEVPA